jgi:hypothetical protein
MTSPLLRNLILVGDISLYRLLSSAAASGSMSLAPCPITR